MLLKRTVQAEDYQNPPEETANLNREPDELPAVDASKFHSKEQAFITRLIKHGQSILTFLIYPGVPPDGNASERAVRT